MTDRELLEAAAKAAGYKVRWCRNGVEGEECECYVFIDTGDRWEPLDDDGDALRLAVRLGIGLGIDMQDEIVSAYAPNPNPAHFSEDAHDADPYAATRRAIVRAAAEIGGKA